MTARATTVAREADRRLEREYEPLKAEVARSLSAKLRGRGIRLPDADLEEYYNQAWHALYSQAASGTEIVNTGGFLVQVAFRRAIDDVRQLRPDERSELPLEAVAAVEHDVVGQLEDQRRLREFAEALREELGERERVAASLCYVHGYTRPQAAELMGLSERRMQKVMDAVSKAIGRITREIQAGERCESRASLNKAYALGLLDPDGERFATARAHLDECPRCRADVLRLRGLASVAPPTLLPWAALHTGGGGPSAKPRRRPRPNPTAAAATAAAVLVAALAALALTRGSSDPEQPAAASLPATSESSSPDSSGSSRSDSSGSRPASRPKRERGRPTQQSRRERQAKPAPVTPVATPVPTPVGAPPPAAAPAPAAEPPVLDDGVQEFGVEP
jgi:RNA polymerase sigma factor (sigma-70 family)